MGITVAQLRVVPCSCQRGKSRYSSKEDDIVPEVAQYRNNLTAMSQYKNLLFVAYLDRIHVFRPEFPLQTLSKTPELIIDLPRSRPGRRGYLDLTCPHAVNHLMVGDLGVEEILVAACDDGDVISYTLHSINQAIEWTKINNAHPCRLQVILDHRLWDQSSRQSEIPTAKPWFLENVGHSAWGLAIHKEARLLAVSSNTQIIDVFAPALRSSGPPGSDVMRDEYRNPTTVHAIGDEKWRTLTCYTSSYRDINLRIRLYGHTTNIPNITFAEVDHQGRYLASTDIEGNMFIWDLYSGSTIFQFQSGTLPTMRGWALACLDPLTSRLTDSAKKTFGCDGHTDEKHTVIDISEGCHSIPDNSHWHPGFAKYGAVPGANSLDVLAMLPQQPIAASESDELSSDGGQEIMGQGSDSDDQVESEAESGAVTDIIQEEPPNSYIPLEHLATGERVLSASSPAEERKPNIRRPKEDNPNSIRVHLPFNLLQTSVSDVCLFRDISYDISTGKPAHTRVISQQTLHQKLPPGLHQLSHNERLNMVAQISELGVVVVGNQVGRVGVLTATRWQALQQSGFRVDYVLPFKSQEEEGLRPQKALMGMAVSPMQGYEYRPDPSSSRDTPQEQGAAGRPMSWGSTRRFRLLMLYYDHTVLSYEISRQSEDEILVV